MEQARRAAQGQRGAAKDTSHRTPAVVADHGALVAIRYIERGAPIGVAGNHHPILEAPELHLLQRQAPRDVPLVAGDVAVATSGDAKRFIVRSGKRYGHILDPTTGWPVDNAPRSITVAADTCTEAGMLATLAMLNGANAEEFLKAQDVQFWCYR